MFDELALKNAVLSGVAHDDIPAFPNVVELAARTARPHQKPGWYGALVATIIFIPIAALAIVNARTIFTPLTDGGVQSSPGFIAVYGLPTRATFSQIAPALSFRLTPPKGLPSDYRLVTIMVMGRDLVAVHYWNREKGVGLGFWLQDPSSPSPPSAKWIRMGSSWLVRGERVTLSYSSLSPAQLRRVKEAMANP